MADVHIVIPAYQPTTELPQLLEALFAARPTIDVLVVDDGSDTGSRRHFDACAGVGAHVLRLPVNRGKGYALRAGFTHLQQLRVTGPVVTADADGQHTVADILAVGDAVDCSVGAAPHLVLGQRGFDGQVPLRSRLGNAVTRLMFRATTGHHLRDTQTGLRAYPATLLPWLTALRGERYEYEFVMLLRAAHQHISMREVAIRTVYLDDNAFSHFRPVADSIRIYALLLTFAGTSLIAFAMDTVLMLGLHALMGALLPAVVLARLISGTANFTLNRRLVFSREDRVHCPWNAAARYAGLASALLVANYLLLATFYSAGLPLLIAKVLTELVLVVTSYVVQARFVFAHRHPAHGAVISANS